MKHVLSDEEFDGLRTRLARAAGLVFDNSRRTSLGYCVAQRLRETGCADVPAYLLLLDQATERQRLLDEVTIQETHFFRNPPQVRALRQHVLPELLRAAAGSRRLRVWSAGCSTGEEPYTIAMLLRELLPASRGWDVKVVATDVSERALEAARTARYGPRAVQMASPEDLARFFTAAPGGLHEVRPDVRELVELRHHNLVTEPPPFAAGERIDLVLCRNVTIYFARDTTRALMSRLYTCLRDGGYLFLGHSETLRQVSEEFRLVPLGSGDSAAFVYRRLAAGGEQRAVLPDRRTAQDGPPPSRPERRIAPRRAAHPVSAPAALAVPGLEQVRALLADGRYAEAAELAAASIGGGAEQAEACYLRGLALLSARRDEEALVDLRKAVYLAPDAGLGHFLLAGVLDRLGDPVAAAREYAAAADTLGSQPGDATAEELGGRSVRELAALCRQLEGRSGAAR